MPNGIIDGLFKNTLYIRISSDLLSVRLVDQNCTYEDLPLIALAPDAKGRRRVVGVGSEAQTAHSTGKGTVTIHNGFDHPRSCIGDSEIAEATLRHFIRRVTNRLTLLRPTVVIHPLEKIEGGLTEIECRGLHDLAERAGAGRVYVWAGRVLDDQELTSLQFPPSAGRLGWG